MGDATSGFARTPHHPRARARNDSLAAKAAPATRQSVKCSQAQHKAVGIRIVENPWVVENRVPREERARRCSARKCGQAARVIAVRVREQERVERGSMTNAREPLKPVECASRAFAAKIHERRRGPPADNARVPGSHGGYANSKRHSRMMSQIASAATWPDSRTVLNIGRR
jgi:hypothetical protein